MAPLSLGRTKIEGTVRYLGIEVDDALAIGEQVDVNYQGRANMLCRRPSAVSGQQGEFETREPPNEPVSAAIRRQLWRPRHSSPTTGFQSGGLSILSRRTVLVPAYS